MIQTSFRAAAVCDGLFALAQYTFPTAPLVLNGPRVKEDLGDEVLIIGWDPGASNHVVAHRADEDMLGRQTESGQIACYVGVRSGNTDMAAVRARAVAIITDLEAAIRADQDGLDGSVDNASVGPDLGLTHFQDRDGASVGVSFSVSYEAFI